MWSSQAQYKSIQWLIACSCSDHLIIQRLSLVFNPSLCNMRLNSVGCILVLFLYKSKVAVLKLNHRPVSTTSNINGGTCLYLERNRFAIPSDLSVSWHIATQIELKTPADEWSQTQSQSLKQHYQRQHCNFSGHGCSNFCFALVSKYCSIKGLW